MEEKRAEVLSTSGESVGSDLVPVTGKKLKKYFERIGGIEMKQRIPERAFCAII